jgi:hypothetical protein
MVCLPEEWVAVRGIQVPEVAEAAQDDVNRFEAIQALPPPIGELVWDCEGGGAADGKVEVLVVSAALPAVDALIEAMEEAGCVPRRVLAPAVALAAGLANAAPGGRAAVVAGEAHLTLLVAEGRRRVVRTRRMGVEGARGAEANAGPGPQAEGGALASVRAVRLRRGATEQAEGRALETRVSGSGGATYTEGIGVSGSGGAIDTEGVSVGGPVGAGTRREARWFGAEASPDRGLSVSDGEDGVRVGLLAEDLGWLQLEMARVLGRFRGPLAPREVVLVGETLAGAPTAEAVSARLRIPVCFPESADSGIGGLPGLRGTAAAVRLAGAMRLAAEVGSPAAGACLLPAPRKRSLAWRRRQAVVAGFAAAAALTLLPPTAVQVWRTDEARRRAAEAEERVRRLTDLAEGNRRVTARIAEAETARGRADDLIAERSRWTGLLADLQAGVEAVEDAWLESVQLVREPAGRKEPADTSYRVVGHILDRGGAAGAGSSESRLRTLLAALVRSPWVSRLEHERFQRREDGRLRFEVQLALAGERETAGGRP